MLVGGQVGGLMGTFSSGYASDKLASGRRSFTALPLTVMTSAVFLAYNAMMSALKVRLCEAVMGYV